MSLAALLSVALSLAGAPPRNEILVAAAADLQPLQSQLSESFAKTGACQARFTFAASGVLTRQIQNGAPYDVFLSANEAFIQQLRDAGKLRAGTLRVYANGRVGLWSRSGRFRTLEDLLRPELRHLALPNPEHAPYGFAAREALRRMGLWDRLQPKIVYGENVEEAFQYAGSGNADAVLTAWSLVFNKGGILLPAALYPPIRQSGGVVAGNANPGCAEKFMQFLTSPAGQRILARFGF